MNKNSRDTTGNSYQYIKKSAEQIDLEPHKACLKVLSDCEKILNLILHGRADGIINLKKENFKYFVKSYNVPNI